MKPACVKCQRFYRVKKNGFKFVEGMPIGSNVPPGTQAPEMWSPYKLWACDLWRCDGCGHELLSGYAQRPIAEHTTRRASPTPSRRPARTCRLTIARNQA